MFARNSVESASKTSAFFGTYALDNNALTRVWDFRGEGPGSRYRGTCSTVLLTLPRGTGFSYEHAGLVMNRQGATYSASAESPRSDRKPDSEIM